MKTTDVPFLKEPLMSDTKSTAAAKSEDKPAVKPAAASLAPAGASGDPAVHSLLAERQTAVANGDDAAVAAVDEKLETLGVTAK